MVLVKNLCCLLNCKAFGGSRVATRWYTMYLEDTCAICLLASKVLGETRVTTRKFFLWRTCVVCLVVWPSVGRGLRLHDISCILRKLALFFTCKAFSETRVTTRKCFLWRTSVVYLIARPSLGSRVKTRCSMMYLGEQLALFLLVRPWVRKI